MEKRIEILVSNEETAEALLELILHPATAAHLGRVGQINGVIVVDAGQGIEEEAEDAQTTEA
jgi:hypothetical protein